MIDMSGTVYASRTSEWHLGPSERAQRITTAPRVSTASRVVLGGLLLGVLAVAEAATRAAVTDATVQFGVVLCLLALTTTLPLSLGRPTGAALTASAVCVLSLAFFRTLTVAGLAGQLTVLYQLGRYGPSRAQSAASRRGSRCAVRRSGDDRRSAHDLRSRDPDRSSWPHWVRLRSSPGSHSGGAARL